jgi:hypothetical protein
MPNEAQEVLATYVFLDVVDFSKCGVATQAGIVERLKTVVLSAIPPEYKLTPRKDLLFLHTGDGICIVLLKHDLMVEAPLIIALNILKQLAEPAQPPEPPCPALQVRIGIHVNRDNLLSDINEQRNVAGAGINMAQRIMSAADGNQILLSHSIHDLLASREDFMPADQFFRPYHVTVKHGVPVTVYQFIKAGLPGLNTAEPTSIRRYELEQAVQACGLRSICSPAQLEQKQREFEKRLRTQMGQARKRIWLLGVSLSRKLVLDDDLTKLLKDKLSAPVAAPVDKFQVRILLLDAIRSPAVFRTFLETRADVFAEFADFCEQDKRIQRTVHREHDYFKQRLYQSFDNALSALHRAKLPPETIRFYAHNPNGWLVIIDDTAYYQPYTFGGCSVYDARVSFPEGQQMPVFEFRRGATEDVFNLLEDHFRKLWLTSDEDLFMMGARYEDRRNFLDAILQWRKEWLGYVYGALHAAMRRRDDGDERKTPRRFCESAPPYKQVKVTWPDPADTYAEPAVIADYSSRGARLKFKGTVSPEEGMVVKVILPEAENRVELKTRPLWELTANFLRRELFRPGRRFEVMHTFYEKDYTYVGLRVYESAAALGTNGTE